MSERLDSLIKYYLRIVAAIWLGFVPFLYLITYLTGAENISFIVFLNSLFEWAILLPFGFEQNIPERFCTAYKIFLLVFLGINYLSLGYNWKTFLSIKSQKVLFITCHLLNPRKGKVKKPTTREPKNNIRATDTISVHSQTVFLSFSLM